MSSGKISDVSIATLTVPRFCSHTVALWFGQVEAKFAISPIVTLVIKDFYLKETLLSHVASKVQDIIATTVIRTAS